MKRESAKLFNVIVVVGAPLIGANAVILWRSASLTAEESTQRALLAEAAALLEAYYREHGHYPESLAELSFTYPDGGDRSTLESLRYNSDGEFYIVVTKGASSGDEFRVCR